MKKLLLAFLLLPLAIVAQQKKISLDDIYRLGTFVPDAVPGFHSMNDGRYYTELSMKGLLRNDFITGLTTDTLIAIGDAKDDRGNNLPLNDVEWNSDEKKLLIFAKREYIYRRSSKAVVYAYDLPAKKVVQIDTAKVLHATYSPDGSRVAYVKGNNLYIKNLQSGQTTQVTNDGEWNHIINGNCDWVYEEEFEFTKAFQWSKNGTYVAYYKFDESRVPQYNMTMYKGLYPETYSYKYPKAGEANSTIEIHIYNTTTGADVKANIGSETDIYIPRMKWTADDSKLGIAWMNRLQNHLKWLSTDAAAGTTTTLYDETDSRYVEVNDDLTFTADGKHFITRSEKDGYKHIYLYEMNGNLVAQLTKGAWDVADILGIDEKNKTVWFTAAMASPMDRQLFSVNYARKPVLKQISKGAGTHTISMNNDFTYYVDNYNDINTPSTTSIYDSKGKLVKTLTDNASLKEKRNQYALGKAAFIKVPNTKGDTLNGWMLKPADFDAAKKYPVLFCNYGGPGSQQVLDKWGQVSMWHQYLAQNGYIVVCVDNTGTGFRGAEFKKKTYLQLGKLEIEDQIDAAKYLATLGYIDANRIGHWGWSYGGFMSSLAITKGANVFKAAVAVAPVTNWRFYDNIYTERYMRTPQENAKGYDDNSPLNFTKSIKGKFLIIHGTGDDNVHFQNSVMMADKMIENNIDFESGYYPNKNHGIRGGNTTYHIYRKMTEFIFKNL